jgi:hypothetical protein
VYVKAAGALAMMANSGDFRRLSWLVLEIESRRKRVQTVEEF